MFDGAPNNTSPTRLPNSVGRLLLAKGPKKVLGHDGLRFLSGASWVCGFFRIPVLSGAVSRETKGTSQFEAHHTVGHHVSFLGRPQRNQGPPVCCTNGGTAYLKLGKPPNFETHLRCLTPDPQNGWCPFRLPLTYPRSLRPQYLRPGVQDP